MAISVKWNHHTVKPCHSFVHYLARMVCSHVIHGVMRLPPPRDLIGCPQPSKRGVAASRKSSHKETAYEIMPCFRGMIIPVYGNCRPRFFFDACSVFFFSPKFGDDHPFCVSNSTGSCCSIKNSEWNHGGKDGLKRTLGVDSLRCCPRDPGNAGWLNYFSRLQESNEAVALEFLQNL